jgi:hypothetical protein
VNGKAPTAATAARERESKLQGRRAATETRQEGCFIWQEVGVLAT